MQRYVSPATYDRLVRRTPIPSPSRRPSRRTRSADTRTRTPSRRAPVHGRRDGARSASGRNRHAASVLKSSLTSKKGGAPAGPPCRRDIASALELEAVVHVVFDRMRRHPETRDLLHLERDVGIDHVVGEYAALGEKCAIACRGDRAPRRATRTDAEPWRPPRARDRRGSCPSDRRGGSCSARRRAPPSASPRTRDTDLPSDRGSALRCAGPSGSTRTECGSPPSGCARNTRD